jgi:hypothetical protein
LRKNFRGVETKKEIGSGLCRKSQREELHNIYSAPNTIRVKKKKKRDTVAGHGLCMANKKCVQNFNLRA